MRHRPKDYSALWKPVHDISGPRGQQHSIAVAFSALRFTIGPLGNERPNKWIHQSVCVLLSVCIWDAVRPRRAQSPGTQRKGMPLLAGLMNGWHAAPWQRRMWQPPSRKRGAVLNHQGEITWHFTTSSCLAASSAGWAWSWGKTRGWREEKEELKMKNIRLTYGVITYPLLPPPNAPHVGGDQTNNRLL